MSERSERVGRTERRAADAALAAGVAAERATTTPPEDPPPRPTPSGDSRGTKTSGWGCAQVDRAQGGSAGASQDEVARSSRRSDAFVWRVGRSGRVGRGRIHPDLQITGAPLLVGRGRRVLRRGASGRSREWTAARAASAALATAANALTALAQLRPLLRTRKPPPTARYCCAAPALARRQQSLRSYRQAPTLLRRCGAGLAHTLITGADVGDLRRCSVAVGDLRRCS